MLSHVVIFTALLATGLGRTCYDCDPSRENYDRCVNPQEGITPSESNCGNDQECISVSHQFNSTSEKKSGIYRACFTIVQNKNSCDVYKEKNDASTVIDCIACNDADRCNNQKLKSSATSVQLASGLIAFVLINLYFSK